MVYDRQSAYLTWGGTTGTATGGQETWQVGLHLAGPAPAAPAPTMPAAATLRGWLNDVYGPVHTDDNIRLAGGAICSWAKIVQLGTDGKYLDDPVLGEITPTIAGYAGGDTAASVQDSMCVTLWSGSTRGAANFGRIYLPWWAAQVQNTNGRVASVTCAGNVLTLATFFTATNAWAATALGTGVAIRIMSKMELGTTKDPEFVRVGDVKDTQRRRRAQLAEQYSVAAIT
ncbi:MAG TPA: hypothetical protein VGW74_05520 [Propionibacteriaceae bacterium]|nr:hypothetical protein [Propionibacteriaceae bacterium]